jgi:very-short-patch-repair endonuclease
MSPMSVATFLVQGAMEFDLVIFDEASQVKVVDALIPILRGKQIVVVGDSKQMPPTDFFSRTYENEEDEEENKTGDIESILGMFLAQGVNESMLKWHYRSKHDSLINVSNQEFYDGRLMVFPSSGANDKATGLKFNHIPESIYERGTSRTNPFEARKVAEKVMLHAKTNPELTLGVVAFSTAQRDCIILELERLRRQDSSTEKFFSKINLEEFFIKNLENVQGDERDVIYISIGYGRTEHKKVTNSFGPVNREGGERRLNVLITRARLAMEVFCNFTADDLETQSTTPFGVKALKSFLKYAENGVLESRFETGRETDSPFEDEVISAIKKMGYDVEPQVGSAGFFIDIAVKDPNKPGKYILAIECDGASYHSSVSARDRDRLRQNVLEGMGWKFHRIWSTDWFRTQSRQIELLKKAIEIAINESNQTSNSQNLKIAPKKEIPAHKPLAIERNKAVHNVPTVKKYEVIKTIPNITYSVELLEVPISKISDYLFSILKAEGVIHINDAAKRITDAYGIGRIGNRIYDRIVHSAKYGHQNSLFYYSKEFLYHDANKIVEVRDRSILPPTLKKIENVAPEEIQKSLIDTISMGFSLPEAEAISEALSSMGFNRSTEKASVIVGAEIAKLFKEKKIKLEDNRIVMN